MLTLSLMAIVALAVFLVFHVHYEDGIVGRAALGTMALGAIVLLLEAVAGVDRYFSGPVVLLCVGIAAFLGRHTYRFLRSPACRPGPREIPEFLRKT